MNGDFNWYSFLQVLKSFLDSAESEVRSLTTLYSEVVSFTDLSVAAVQVVFLFGMR